MRPSCSRSHHHRRLPIILHAKWRIAPQTGGWGVSVIVGVGGLWGCRGWMRDCGGLSRAARRGRYRRGRWRCSGLLLKRGHISK